MSVEKTMRVMSMKKTSMARAEALLVRVRV